MLQSLAAINYRTSDGSYFVTTDGFQFTLTKVYSDDRPNNILISGTKFSQMEVLLSSMLAELQ